MGDRLATIDMGRKVGRLLCPFPWPGAGSHLTVSPSVEAYLRAKWHLDPSSRLATTDMGQKLGTCHFFLGEELYPHLTQCGLGRGLPPYQVASKSIKPFGHSTPTSKTGQDTQDRQQSDNIGRTFYKWSRKNRLAFWRRYEEEQSGAFLSQH